MPARVERIRVIAIGGEGGGAPIARAGRVSALVPVTPGEILTIRVGGNGTSSSGGYNGGAPGGIIGRTTIDGYGGGGASDIREHGDALSNRILVAGGGGGQGAYDASERDGPWGLGGKGGTVIGGPGANGWGSYSQANCDYGGCGGSGGNQNAGGAGGAGGRGNTYCYPAAGSIGTLGNGGAGAVNGSRQCGGVGGGGGGGYFGGGGGGQGSEFYSSGYYNDGGGGGGGGGSSYAEHRAKDVHMWQGWNKNEYGLIVFSW